MIYKELSLPEDYSNIEVLYKKIKAYFPDDNELNTFDILVDQWYAMRGKYHIICAYNNCDIVGGIIGSELSDSIFCEVVYVVDAYRKQGISTMLRKELLKVGENKLLFVEAVPDKVEFWKYNGAKRVDINYIAPPLEENGSSVDKYELMVLEDNNLTKLGSDYLLQQLKEYFLLCYNRVDDYEKYLTMQNIDGKSINLI